MARGLTGTGQGGAVGYLLRQGGSWPSELPAPMRPGDPMPSGAQWHTGPNLTDYQKQLFLSLQQSVPVVQPTAFQRCTTIGFNLTTADVQAVTAPPEIRSFLLIRNDQTSTGNVLVALDTVAAASTAFLVLSPGGYALFDTFVPQNDIHVAAATLTALCVITYANARFRPSAG